jgi:hypothetical protein
MVARANFSDNQDYALVQLVLQHQSASGRIDWERVTRQFPGPGSGSRVPKKSTLELQQRLKVLKRTHGTNLQAFPHRFFRQATERSVVPKPPNESPSSKTPRRQPSALPTRSSPTTTPPSQPPAVRSSPPQTQAAKRLVRRTKPSVVSSKHASSTQDVPITATVTTNLLQVCPAIILESFDNAVTAFENAQAVAVTASASSNVLDVYSAIARIFARVTRADVRQPSGARGLNSGEILPVGVTKMIQAMRIDRSDVFGDIGSGTGSVLAQVALQTAARRCVGVEIRKDLAARSEECMREFIQEFPRLSRVSIFTGDIKDLTKELREGLQACTILYCNNKVFEPKDNLAVQEYIALSEARLVLLMDRFCRRCYGDRCVNKFCQMWESEPSIEVSVSWTAKPVEMFVYHRRIDLSRILCADDNQTSLLSLIEAMDDD